MNISEDSLKLLSNVFIGDSLNIYKYKSGSSIYHFFNKYYGYSDTYSFGESHPSRWMMVYNKLIELWNKGMFDSFLTKILSLAYLKTEFPVLSVDELKKKSQDALIVFNKELENDGNKIIEFADCFKLLPINDDEVLLGEGGYAYCYYIKSKNIVEKRLKEDNYLDSGVVSRFKREYNLTKSLDDINGIIKVFDFYPDRLAYTMERGECDLYSYIKDNVLNDEAKRRIIYQIVTIMKNVHERDAIHRDLSPKNIFLFSGLLKIADFGLGKDLNAFYSHQTMKTNSVGQYYYCDPRQFMKLKDGDKQSDIYSIGKIINFVYTGSPNNSNHKYYTVVAKATEQNEKYRYKCIDDLLDGLKNIDTHIENEEFYKQFNYKINNKRELTEEDIMFICSFDSMKMYQMIETTEFREKFVSLREDGYIEEQMFISKIELLLDFIKDNRFLGWDNYDRFGYLALLILDSNCSYVEKELAIELLNIPISCDRYGIINLVKQYVIGNIDPSLEDKIDSNIKNYS